MVNLNKKEEFFKWIFLIAALYDLILGALFFLFYKPLYEYFNITLPTYPMYLQMAAAFVIAMGVGYCYIYKNIYRNVDLVKLGVVYKAVYSGLTAYFYFFEVANVVFFWFALIDVIFLVLFVWFLMYAKEDERYERWK